MAGVLIARVMPVLNIDGLAALRWVDVPDDGRLAELEAAGLVRRTGLLGEPPPSIIPRLPCCGR